RRRIELNGSVVRRILNHVERDVAEVTLVGNAVTAAKARLAIAEDIPGEAKSGSEVVLVRLPEFANRAVLRKHDLAVGNLLEPVRPASKIEVGVKLLPCVVLSAVVLVPDSQVQSESWLHLPRIVEVGSPLVIAVAAAEVWRSQRSGW